VGVSGLPRNSSVLPAPVGRTLEVSAATMADGAMVKEVRASIVAWWEYLNEKVSRSLQEEVWFPTTPD
jgi:hypothetical protein